jgi:hypothetical protein
MDVDASSADLLHSVLSSEARRKLFRIVVNRRIAPKEELLTRDDPDASRELDALTQSDLIGVSSDGEKYFVTATGLKIARDLNKLAAI